MTADTDGIEQLKTGEANLEVVKRIQSENNYDCFDPW